MLQKRKILADSIIDDSTLSNDDRVRAWVPDLKRKPCFLENFPPDLRSVILKTLESILAAKTPKLAAHEKRDDDVIRAIGTSSEGILKSFLKQCPFVKLKYKNLSSKTIRHLFTAPHQGRLAARAYKGLINVRLIKGRNDLEEDVPYVRIAQSYPSFCFDLFFFLFRVTSIML